MSKTCLGCGKTFTRVAGLRKHQKQHPTKLTISEVFKECGIPKSPITDAFCDADVLHLPEMDLERRKLFGDFIPRISTLENWKSSYSFDKIRRIVLADILRSKKPLKVWNAGAKEALDDCDAAASVIHDLDAEENPPQAYIMQTPVPTLEAQVAPTRELCDNLTIYKYTPVSANLTPKHSLVDVHHDPSHTVVTLFGKPKLWIIWPPTKENLRALQDLYGQENKFLRFYDQLKGGVFLVQKANQTLLLPPYNPHTTFSIGGSIICGYEFEAIECFPIMVSCLHVEIEYLDHQYQNENDRRREYGSNLETWLDGLECALKDGNDTIKRKVVEAWVANISTIKVVFQKTKGYEDRACTIWEEFLENTTISQCPSCSGNLTPFQDHMMSEHVALIRPQDSRAKKRAGHHKSTAARKRARLT